MRDFRPFLQIVHVSDLHVVAPGFAGWPALRALARSLATASPGLADALREDAAPHDPWCPVEFRAFLEAVTLGDPLFRRLPTWLVDSGDLTSFGDDPSLAL